MLWTIAKDKAFPEVKEINEPMSLLISGKSCPE